MRIVKYFDPEKDWSNYKSGSFKFGTLKGYRESNEVGDRFSDRGEGITHRHYGRGAGSVENLQIGNVSIGRLESVPVGEAGSNLRKVWDESPPSIVTVMSTFNCNVFCASIGPYEKSHHVKMLKGEISEDREYRGNEKLTAFAEIDLSKFERAIKMWAMRVSEYTQIRSASVEFMRSRMVSYGPRSFDYPLEAVHGENEISHAVLDKLIFSKPEKYSTEREYRCALMLYPWKLLEKSVDVFPKSFALRKCILRLGRL